MARPKKQDGEKRDSSIPPIRMTGAEHAYLENKATLAGVSITEFVRKTALGATVNPPRGQALNSLLAELNRVGNNVNQIARQLNRGRDHDPHHLNHVLHELTQVLEKIGRKI